MSRFTPLTAGALGSALVILGRAFIRAGLGGGVRKGDPGAVVALGLFFCAAAVVLALREVWWARASRWTAVGVALALAWVPVELALD